MIMMRRILASLSTKCSTLTSAARSSSASSSVVLRRFGRGFFSSSGLDSLSSSKEAPSSSSEAKMLSANWDFLIEKEDKEGALPRSSVFFVENATTRKEGHAGFVVRDRECEFLDMWLMAVPKKKNTPSRKKRRNQFKRVEFVRDVRKCGECGRPMRSWHAFCCPPPTQYENKKNAKEEKNE